MIAADQVQDRAGKQHADQARCQLAGHERPSDPRSAMRGAPGAWARVHLVMVPNPPYHAIGDFALAGDRVERDGPARLTFGNIGIYDTTLFRELPRGVKIKMLPLYHQWIDRRIVSGERYDGAWQNVGTPADLAALDAALTSGMRL